MTESPIRYVFSSALRRSLHELRPQGYRFAVPGALPAIVTELVEAGA